VTEAAVRFYNSIADAEKLTQSERIDFFAYFLTQEMGQASFTLADLRRCFEDCFLAVPSFIAQHLSKGTKSKPRRYLKASVGYRLEKHMRDGLADRLGAETHKVQIPVELRQLEGQVPPGSGREWLKESIDCFGVEAYRATLMMVWLYALDHLFQYILKHKLVAFNAALAAHPDQRSAKKVGTITQRDQFTLLGEDMFLDLCKTSNTISPDVKRILLEKLGTRNSAAHPSGITITRNKAVEFAQDLVLNVVLKYPL
jgi:hypothetical protein